VDVSVTACDTPASGEQACTVEDVTVIVTNVSPTVTLGNVTGTAGTPVALPLSVSDPAPADVLEVRIDWGDGTAIETLAPYSGAAVSHTYASAGTFQIEVQATDDDGGSATATARATIGAVVPPPVSTDPPPTSPPVSTDPPPTSPPVSTDPPSTTSPPVSTDPVPTPPGQPDPDAVLPGTGGSIGSVPGIAWLAIAAGVALLGAGRRKSLR
jgi:hypothetical protein